ncbi:heavy-metal-associated domain-containing protein [Clostridium polynesiense]|uniref:heavy-metal-associated domain-containing protein n=1 Tax=Clostridium polynesiense TaxID=1325933 RepID=UPI00058E3155|nr:cation transporter [Clostridium polynesiense]
MKAKLIISGMSCGHCVKRVDNALKSLEGINSAEVSVGEAVIEGNVSIEQVKEAIDDAGYDVEKVEEL